MESWLQNRTSEVLQASEVRFFYTNTLSGTSKFFASACMNYAALPPSLTRCLKKDNTAYVTSAIGA